MALADQLKDSSVGSQVRGREGYWGFVPSPLPSNVPLTPELAYLLDEASRAVAMLSGVGETLPNPRLLINPFLRREAVLSSRIEGTQASVSDLLRFEAFEDRSAAGSEDVREVLNYITALNRGMELLGELPISTRLMNAVHAVLLKGVRRDEAQPGEHRNRQVWIGPPGSPVEDARFVPPAAEEVPNLLSNWERWVNEEHKIPPLVKCALMHYQFKTIHPYLDGNGRLGRLLIILFLSERKVLTKPLLYLSAYFERHRTEYYSHLLNMSISGDWAPWLAFFLEGVLGQANDAVEQSRRVRRLHLEYRDRLQRGRQSGTTLALLDEVFASPIQTAASVARLLDISNQGARNVLDRLADARILEPEAGWPRFYVARELLALTAE